MFVLSFAISLIASLFGFALMCKDFNSNALFFFSSLIATIVSWKLITMETRSKQNEEEIAKLKQHLGIKDGDRVNSSDDIMSGNHEK